MYVDSRRNLCGMKGTEFQKEYGDQKCQND